MRRIAVIGCPGSGKSWFAERLGAITGLPVEHLDDHFWHPSWTPTPAGQWRDLVGEVVSRPEWIIDGHYGSTIDLTIGNAAGVVLLDLPTPLCLYGALCRFVRVLAGDRSPLPKRMRDQPGRPPPGTNVREFLSFIMTFRRKRLVDAIDRLAARPSTCAVVLHSRREVRDLLRSVGTLGVASAFEQRRVHPSMLI